MKNIVSRYFFALAFCAVVSMISVSSASADVFYQFTRSATGGVNVVGTGSGLVNRPDGVASDDWDVNNFITNFLEASFGNTQTGADSASGTFTNVTTSTSVDVTSFAVDADGSASSDNDLDFDTSAILSFSFEDEFSYSMTATFDVGTLAYTDLIPGQHVDVGRTQGAGISEESFGVTFVSVSIPEPSTMALSLACFAAAGVMRRRR